MSSKTTPATPSRKAALEAEYQKIKSNYPDTPDGQWQLAEWCRQHYLGLIRETHLKRVIELEPDHIQARRALGYSKHNGKWATQEELMTERGYVRSGGRWRLPEEIEQNDAKRKQRGAENHWQGTIKKWRSLLATEHAAEATANFRAINDPTAVKALKKAWEGDTNPNVRQLYVAALGHIATPDAIGVLVKVSLLDPVEEVRLTAIDHLTEKKYPEVVAMYIQGLHDKDNVIVNRAAVGLQYMDNPAAIPALIDALITMHEFVIVQGSPGISSTFGSYNDGHGHTTPMSGLSTGQSVSQVTVPYKNAAVRDALIKMTNQNYDFNVATWKAWLANRKKAPSLDARRS